MKYLFIILLLLLTACDSKKKEAVRPISESVETLVKEIQTTSLEKEKVPEIEFNLTNMVLKNLNLKKENCNVDLIATQQNPENWDEIFFAIPEISNTDINDETYFTYNSHIVVADANTGEIKQHYFESSKTNDWVSDAVFLAEIKIDTAPYLVSKTDRAFGVSVYYYNRSHPNPYSYKSLSLYIKKEDTLLKMLNKFNIMESHGETDTVCYGDFTDTKKILIMTKEQTNGYFNILVKTKFTKTKRRPDETNECIDIEEISKTKNVLKFSDGAYK